MRDMPSVDSSPSVGQFCQILPLSIILLRAQPTPLWAKLHSLMAQECVHQHYGGRGLTALPCTAPSMLR